MVLVASPAAGPIGGRLFWFWMFTFVAFPLGGIVALSIVGPMEGVVQAALGGALAGVVVGASQWLVLRRFLGTTTEWVLATVAGLALGDTVGVLLTGAGTDLADLILLGAVTGAAVGLAQWPQLRGRVRYSGLWVPVVAASWAGAWAITGAAGLSNVAFGYVVFDVLGALAFTAVTGLALWSMLWAEIRATYKAPDVGAESTRDAPEDSTH